MSYQVLARKWRPRHFGEMVGQQHVLRTLQSALQQERLHHAYLFTGTRGVGKTTIARILARCLNCEQGITATPCGTCGSCVEISEGRFVDLIEVDAASKTKVDDTRELLDNVQYRPTRGRYKIYLIDEVHMLSKHSFNALLKTLEEPPPHVIFLLATTDPQMLPATVLSRCLQFHLKNMTAREIHGHLTHILETEQISFDPEALESIAISAKGSMRDSLSLLDQAIAYGDGAVTSDDVQEMLGSIDRDKITTLIELVAQSAGTELLSCIDDIDQYAPNYADLLDRLIEILHRTAVLQVVDSAKHSETASQNLETLATNISAQDIQLFYQIALHAKKDLYLSPDGRLGFEMCLLRMMSFKINPIVRAGSSEGPDAVKKSDSSPSLAGANRVSNKTEQAELNKRSDTTKPPAKAVSNESGTDNKEQEVIPPQAEQSTSEDYSDALSYYDATTEESATRDNLSDAHQRPEPTKNTSVDKQPVAEATIEPQTKTGWDINAILRPRSAEPKQTDYNPASGAAEITPSKINNELRPEQPTEESSLSLEPEYSTETPQMPTATEPEVPLSNEPSVKNENVIQAQPSVQAATDSEPDTLSVRSDKNTETAQSTPAIPMSQPESAPLNFPVTLTELSTENWHQVVESLSLRGIPFQIALASQVAHNEQEQLHLSLESNMWNALSAEPHTALRTGLSHLISGEFHLKILEQQPEYETPRQRRRRIKEERYQEARQSLQTDPVVIGLEKTFNATLDLESVEPISE